MDYRDYELGVPGDFFWFRAKRGLIEILLGRASRGMRAPVILDVGSGVGEDLDVISRFGGVHVIDTDPRAIGMIPEGLVRRVSLMSATALDYPDGYFDMVVAFDSLEHIEDDRGAVAEISRVLRPGGRFVFSVPAHEFLFGGHDRALMHHRRYTKASLGRLLRGLRRETLGYWTCLLFAPLAAQRLMDRRRERPSMDYFRINPLLNSALHAIMRAENSLIRAGVGLPIGTSLYGIYQKGDDR